MEKLEKLKAKYPIGSILKHKHCNLMYRVINFEYNPRETVNKVLTEIWVHLEILFYPLDEVGKIKVIGSQYLRELEISSEDYLNKLLEKRGKRK